MYWQAPEDQSPPGVTSTVVDLSFRFDCPRLPVDHAWPMGTAVREKLPWIESEPLAGVHLVHGAESGNGWYRPGPGGHLQLSRRSRFRLRMPRHRVDAARTLTGTCIEFGEYRIDVGEATEMPLTASKVLFSRHVVIEDDDAQCEEGFLAACVAQLGDLGIRPSRMLCGRLHVFAMPDGDIGARSLMLADLKPEDAIRLQERGLGGHRGFGMGLFLPHKGIDAVYRDDSD